MIAVGAIAIDFALRSLLIDQAKLQLTQTAAQIEAVAREASSFPFAGDAPVTIRLSDRATLDRWASANEYVQIDNGEGQILGKSSNLGGVSFTASAADLHSSAPRFTTVQIGGNRPGTMLVLNRTLTDAENRPLAIAYVGQRLDIVADLIARARTILLEITLAAMVVIAAASYFIAAWAIDPIERLTTAVAEILEVTEVRGGMQLRVAASVEVEGADGRTLSRVGNRVAMAE